MPFFPRESSSLFFIRGGGGGGGAWLRGKQFFFFFFFSAHYHPWLCPLQYSCVIIIFFFFFLGGGGTLVVSLSNIFMLPSFLFCATFSEAEQRVCVGVSVCMWMNEVGQQGVCLLWLVLQYFTIICLFVYFVTGPHSYKLCLSWGPSDFAVYF